MRGERSTALEDGPWTHLLDAGPGTEGSYQYGENVYPADPIVADTLVGRPGRRRTNLDYVVAPVPGGGVRTINGISQLILPFVQYTVAVVDGNVLTYNWIADSWTAGPLPGVLAGLGITMDPSATIYLVQLRNALLFSDGVHTPWVWDGLTPFAGSITKLTNCPVLYGKPVLRGGRIYGIKDADHTVLVWSEVDQPNLGYEAGGYNNAWQITQTNPNKLTAIHADNAGLTLFRRRSSTRIYGEDPQEFVTGNAEDTLDEKVGVVSPRAMVELHRGLLVLDAHLHAQLVMPGAESAMPVWHGLGATVAQIAKKFRQGSDLPAEYLSERVIASEYEAAGLVLFALPPFSNDPEDWDPLGVSPESWVLVYDVRPATPRAVGVWRGLGIIQSMATVRDASRAESDEYLMFGADGEIFLLGDPDQDQWDDAQNAPGAAARAVRHVFETRPLGYSTTTEKHFDRLALVASAPTVQTLQAEVLAPDLDAPPQTMTFPPVADGEDAKLEIGTEARGRYGHVRITHQTLGEQFGLSALSVGAVVAGRNPGGR